ncbi:MAG: ABC transporter permease [bacterium JZ-2024 1]
MLSICVNDLRRMFKDPMLWVWLFLMPIVFTYFTGRFSSAPRPPRAEIKVENEDAGPLGNKFVDALRSDRVLLILTPDDEKAAEADAILKIPGDFSARLDRNEQVEVTLRVVATGGSGRLAESVVWQGWYRFLEARAKGDNLAQEGSHGQGSLIVLREELLKGGRQIPRGYQQAVPGNLVTFVLVILLTSGSATLALERAHGLLRRLASAPLPRLHIVLAKALSRLALAAIQIGIFVILGATVFKVDWGDRPFPLALVIGGFALTSVGIGMWTGSRIRTPEAAAGLGVLIALSLASLGGAWWPLEVVSPPLQTVARLLPTGWVMNAIHSLTLFQEPFRAIIREVLALYLVGGVTLYLAGRRIICQ